MPEYKVSKLFEGPSLGELDDEGKARLKALKNAGTTTRDERFPSCNQALHCWNRYNEWVLCTQQSSEKKCEPMLQLAYSVCPELWMEKWDEEREEGSFCGIGNRFDAAKKGGHH
mmetsp:Transcript_22812/g.49781  ORF Transcript_22812/g.49781 Transcript_22812/m.49781 type:complete len:114 (-) Transcript_22812:24-365(-)